MSMQHGPYLLVHGELHKTKFIQPKNDRSFASQLKMGKMDKDIALLQVTPHCPFFKRGERICVENKKLSG